MLRHPLVHAFSRHQKAACQVGLDHGVPAFEGHVFQGRGELAARIVDQRIDAPVPREHGLDGGLHGRLVADIADGSAGGTAFGCYFGRHGSELVGIATKQHHVRTQRGQFMRRAAPDSGTAAGHQHHLPGKQAGAKHRTVCHTLPSCSLDAGLPARPPTLPVRQQDGLSPAHHCLDAKLVDFLVGDFSKQAVAL